MSLNLWPTEAKQLRKTKAENLKSALSTCPRWPFSARFFLHIFVVVVALLNLRPKDTISIWGACESLASARRLHFISLCFVARRFNFRLNAKQKVSLWPERKVALHVDLSWLGAGQARHKTKDTAIHLAGWLPENGHGATFSTWLIFTI